MQPFPIAHDEIRAAHGAVHAGLPEPWRGLSSALAADALDGLGRRCQCLAADVRPLALEHKILGRAFPVRSVPAASPEPEHPYQGLLAALDDLPGGAIFIFGTQRSDAAGVWGELITTAFVASGAAGALTDGLIRDVTRVLDSGFPVFSRGATPYDSKGRLDVVEHNVELTIDGVVISPGDLIVGDADGVCVVPHELENQVLALAQEKLVGEGAFRAAVHAGMGISDAFRTYGIL